MSNKPNSKKIKIIQFKDVVSLMVIVVMLFCSFTYSYGALLNKAVIDKKSDGGMGGFGIIPPTNVTADDLLEFIRINNEFCDNFDKYFKSVVESGKNNNLNNLTFDKKYNFPTDSGQSLNKKGWRLINCVRTSAMMSDPAKTPFYACTFIKEDECNINLVIVYNRTVGDIGEAFTDMADMFVNVKWDQLTKDLVANPDLLHGDFEEIIKKYVPNSENYFDGNWEQDFIGSMIFGYTGSEGEAKTYATKVAEYFKKYNTKGKSINVHVTGHSLGGYLAQVGGAEMLRQQNSTFSVKQVGYFNSMGLHINNKQLKERLGATRYNIITSAYDILAKNKSKVTSYQTRGDWCSGFGTHAGSIKEYYLHSDVIKAANGGVDQYNKDTDTIGKYLTSISGAKLKEDVKPALKNILTTKLLQKLLKTLGDTLGNEKGKTAYKYASIYYIPDLMKYFEKVHDLCGFEGWNLTEENRKVGYELKSIQNMPDKIKIRKTATILVDIITENSNLGKLDKDDFEVHYTQWTLLKITDVSLVSEKKKILDKNTNSYQIIYRYRVSVQSRLSPVPNPVIVLKSDSFVLNGASGFQQLVLKSKDLLFTNKGILMQNG